MAVLSEGYQGEAGFDISNEYFNNPQPKFRSLKIFISFLLSMLMLCAACFSVFAQAAGHFPSGEADAINQIKSISAGNGWLWADGEQLTDSDILTLLGQDTYDAYARAKRQIAIGSAVTTAGAALAGAGVGYAIGGYLASLMTGNREYGRESLIKGGIMAAIGVIPLAVGIPVTRKGQRSLENIAAGYGEDSVTGILSFGTTPNGIGLCYRF